MAESFDVQRDHLSLMKDLKRILRRNGTIMFSNNKRGFQMDLDGLSKLGLSAKEITSQTLSQDFARNRQIHNCWLLSHAGEEKIKFMSLISMSGAWLSFSDSPAVG